jgi:hypothetical protein
MSYLEKEITITVQVELTRYAPGIQDEQYPNRCGVSDSEVKVTMSDVMTGAKILDITDWMDPGDLEDWALELEGEQ